MQSDFERQPAQQSETLVTAKSAGKAPWPADHVERWPIERLMPYARNARKIMSKSSLASRTLQSMRPLVPPRGIRGTDRSRSPLYLLSC